MSDRALRVTMISRRVAPAHGPGGLETVVREQVLEIARGGIEVDLWTELPRDAGRRAEAEATFGDRVQVHWVAPGPLPLGRVRGTVVLDRITNYPLWSQRVARAIDDPGDIVHVQGLAGLGAASRRRSGDWQVPLVLTTHGMEEFLVGGLKRAMYAPFRAGMRYIAAVCDRVVVTDRTLLSLVSELLDLSADRAVVIPNAIYPDAGLASADRDAARRLLGGAGHQDREFKLVSMGRFEANKGFELLARALGHTGDSLGDWVWILIGDGPRRPMIEKAIAAAGIQDRCLLAGRVDDPLKHGLLAGADWFVHPTLFEGSSIVTLEAMAHGLPILGTRAGGLPDKVEEGVSGLLVEPGDVKGLEVALRSARDAAAVEFGARGRAIVEARFSWDVIRPAFVTLYRELAGGNETDRTLTTAG